MKLNNLLLLGLVLFVLMVILAGTSPIHVQASATPCTPGASWVQTPYGLTPLVDFTMAEHCYWNANDLFWPSALQRSGACGLPKQHNDLIALAHNDWCDFPPRPGASCHYDTAAGTMYAWPALKVGEPVSLCANGALYQGKVTQVIHEALAQGVTPQTEFVCPTGTCGTLTTCAGVWTGSDWAYAVVRVAYRRVR